ncbi:hypothetical protein ACHAW6_001013 [Cyclotella cf. meneghiniana]
MFYLACPIIKASKLQSQVALSTTTAKFIAMSISLHEVIPLMELIKKSGSANLTFQIHGPTYTAKFVRKILAYWNLQYSQGSVHVLSISRYAIISFANTSEKD